MEDEGVILELLVYFVDPVHSKEGENAFLGGRERVRVRLDAEEMTRYVFDTFSEHVLICLDEVAPAAQF